MLQESFSLLDSLGLNPTLPKVSRIKAGLLAFIWAANAALITATPLFYDIELENLVDAYAGGGVAYQMVAKSAVLLLNRKKFMETINCIKEFWPNNRFGDAAARNINVIQYDMKRIMKLYKYSILLAGFFYFMKPIYERRRILPITCLPLCNTQSSLTCYIANYVYQICWVFAGLCCTIAFDVLFFGLLSYGYIELEQVKYAIMNLNIDANSSGDEQQTLNEIAVLVAQHVRTLDFITEVNRLFTGTHVIQLSSSLSCLCAGLFLLSYQGFPPTGDLVVRYATFFFSILLQVFVYCAIGSKISEQSESIADEAYASKWSIKSQPKVCKAICLIIQRAQKRIQITAGGIWILDMNTFISVLKGSMSVLAFMQTVYNRE